MTEFVVRVFYEPSPSWRVTFAPGNTQAGEHLRLDTVFMIFRGENPTAS